MTVEAAQEMDPLEDIETVTALEALRDAKPRFRVHIMSTGAGAGLQSLLWSICGCSRFLAGAEFPYTQDATIDALGFDPVRYAAGSTAVDLAIAAFMRAIATAEDAIARPIGIGIAASVASRELHRGEHRVHVAAITDRGCRLTSAVLAKGSGSEARIRDGRIADVLGLRAILEAAGLRLGSAVARRVHGGSSVLSIIEQDADELASERLLANPLISPDRRRASAAALQLNRTMLHPCTANPPHMGHIMGALAALDSHHGRSAVTMRMVHALTLDPPNKPQLTVADALRRARALGRLGSDALVSRGDPLYVDKAERFPGAPIVLGADAAMRMLDPRWGRDPVEVLARFAELGTRLYVVGRLIDHDFVTVEHPLLRRLIPAEFRFLFRHVPGRWDVASSDIRAAATSSA